MKPVMNPQTLRTALIVSGYMLGVLGTALLAYPALCPPPIAALMLTISGLMLGKEKMQRTGDVSIAELPLEWRPTEPPVAPK